MDIDVCSWYPGKEVLLVTGCQAGGMTPNHYCSLGEMLKLKSRTSPSFAVTCLAIHPFRCSHHETALVALNGQLQQATQARQEAANEANRLKRELDGPITVGIRPLSLAGH